MDLLRDRAARGAGRVRARVVRRLLLVLLAGRGARGNGRMHSLVLALYPVLELLQLCESLLIPFLDLRELRVVVLRHVAYGLSQAHQLGEKVLFLLLCSLYLDALFDLIHATEQQPRCPRGDERDRRWRGAHLSC
jgi:hypothetical protein